MTEKTNPASPQSDLDAVIEAGRILMESGAEIYRIEETMGRMAAAIGIDEFDAYVVNRGIIISGTNSEGLTEAKVTTVPETSLHLGKLEAVNALSREISEHGCSSCAELFEKLKTIENAPADPLWQTLLAYFIGAGGFARAIGSSAAGSLCSAISGLVMGLVLRAIQKHVRTRVLQTVIASAAISLTANVLYIAGLGESRSLIILGALMLLVPGAVFTNSVREFSENNYQTGLTLLMSALLTCLSLAVGVAVVIELLPFAEQMTGVFPDTFDTVPEILIRTAMAGIGNIGFAFLIHAPKRFLPDLSILGGLSWLLYLLMNLAFHNDAASIFAAALFCAFFSRVLAVRRKCPFTVFLSTSIFPLLPGLSLYRGVYFMLTGTDALAVYYMRSCFISAFAIALAIIIIQQVPARALGRFSGRS